MARYLHTVSAELFNNSIIMEEENKINIESEEQTDEVSEQPTADEMADAKTSEEPDKDPLDIALQEIADLKDKNLRQMAEFDNYRKRTLKERAELILNGGEKVITAILPVIDDMERALQNPTYTTVGSTGIEDPAVLRQGMELIYHKLIKTLEGLGVKQIETDNADFDTDVHEAVALVPGMGDDKKGKVIDCMQTGYKLNDKVIRHAKVAVGQ